MRTGYWKLFFVVALIGLGKLSGFFKDVMITFYHGVSVVTDAYFLSSSIASLLYIAVYASVPVLVVPLYSRLSSSASNVDANRGLSSFLVFFVIISVALALSVFGFSLPLVDFFSKSTDEGVNTLAVDYLKIMALTFVLSTLVAFYNSVQTVNKNIMMSYAVPVVNNSIFCLGLILFSLAGEFYRVLLLGVAAWFVLVVFNYCYCRRWIRFELKASFSFLNKKEFLFLLLPAAMSFYIEQANGFIGVYFSSELGGGAISVFSYSNKINMIVLSVFLVFLTTSLFPKMASVAAKGNNDELGVFVLVCLRVAVIFGGPVILFMNFYSAEIVALLFQRGSFSSDDSLRVASVFKVILIALPFMVVRDVMNRVCFSYNNTLVPLFVSIVALMVNISLSYVLYREYELIGLASAALASVAINCIIMMYLVQKKIKYHFVVPFLKLTIVCAFSGVGAYLLLYWLDSFLSEYWLVLFVPFFFIYFFVLLCLKIQEVLVIKKAVGKLFLNRFILKS